MSFTSWRYASSSLVQTEAVRPYGESLMSRSASSSSLTYGAGESTHRAGASVSPRSSELSTSKERAKTNLHDPHHRTKRLLRHDLHRVVDIDEHLRRDVRRPRLRERKVFVGDQGPGALRDCAWGGAVSSRSLGEGGRARERKKNGPASAMWARIINADRRLTTGPSVVSSFRGSPSLYPCTTRRACMSSIKAGRNETQV